MRPILPACRSGLFVATAVVLLSACGGSDEVGPAADGSGSADSSPPSASATGSGGDPANAEFCTDAAAIQERVGSTLTDQSDVNALPQALQAAAAEIRAVEPPKEIAADWNALADGVDQVAEAFASVDFNDPNALATFQQQVGQLQTELTAASTNVENYLRDECGLDTGEGEPATPSR